MGRVVRLGMRSVVYTEAGAPSVLHLVEREVPEPGPHEVRVRVEVSGVNPTDWKSRSGAAGPLPFPEVVPNQDGSGVVDAVGEGADNVSVGQRVWTAIAAYQNPHGGTAQQFVVLPAERVFPLPDTASFELGASLGVPAVTAHRALTVADGGPTSLQPGALDGRVVLVAGGAGAVGHAAIQLARWSGATVITTVSSPEKAELARAAGAHHVVNYREADTAAEVRAIAPDGVDLIVEVAPAQNAELDLAVIRNHGTISVYADNGGESVTLPIRNHFALNVRYQFLLLYTVGIEAITTAAADINAAVEAGALPIGDEAGLPLSFFDLAQAADAHAAVEDGVVGKVLIRVAS